MGKDSLKVENNQKVEPEQQSSYSINTRQSRKSNANLLNKVPSDEEEYIEIQQVPTKQPEQAIKIDDSHDNNEMGAQVREQDSSGNTIQPKDEDYRHRNNNDVDKEMPDYSNLKKYNPQSSLISSDNPIAFNSQHKMM